MLVEFVALASRHGAAELGKLRLGLFNSCCFVLAGAVRPWVISLPTLEAGLTNTHASAGSMTDLLQYGLLSLAGISW